MRKINAVNKRNGRKYIITIIEAKENALALDVEKGTEKEVTFATIRRWYELGEEIKEEKKEVKKSVKKSGKGSPVKKKEKYQPSAVKKDGTVRTDKFRPKLEEFQVKEIRAKFEIGAKKSHLAKEYGVSFRTITCIVERLMWKHVS